MGVDGNYNVGIVYFDMTMMCMKDDILLDLAPHKNSFAINRSKIILKHLIKFQYDLYHIIWNIVWDVYKPSLLM